MKKFILLISLISIAFLANAQVMVETFPKNNMKYAVDMYASGTGNHFVAKIIQEPGGKGEFGYFDIRQSILLGLALEKADSVRTALEDVKNVQVVTIDTIPFDAVFKRKRQEFDIETQLIVSVSSFPYEGEYHDQITFQTMPIDVATDKGVPIHINASLYYLFYNPLHQEIMKYLRSQLKKK